jgi:hypothetical protein
VLETRTTGDGRAFDFDLRSGKMKNFLLIIILVPSRLMERPLLVNGGS